MITNLPNNFPLEQLEHFSFGGAEPQTDPLLETLYGFSFISPVKLFLNNEKSIIVGERGTGKTTLFDYISKGKLKFRNDNNQKQILVSINDKLLYSTIKNTIIPKLHSYIGSETFTYGLVWELYIIYKILISLKNDSGLDLSGKIKEYINNFEVVFGIGKKNFSIIEFISNLKFNLKIDIDPIKSYPVLTPSIEPKKIEGSDLSVREHISIDIGNYKKEIQNFLETNQIIIYILIDRLDEFEVKEEYKVQKQFLQALLEVERDYLNYSNFKLKIFLRQDLFNQLDFSGLGFDKIVNRKIVLLWTDSDIRLWIAQRIAYNLIKKMNLNKLKIYIDQKILDVDEDMFNYQRYYQKQNALIEGMFFQLRKLFFSNFEIEDKREARIISLEDKINKIIMTSIFPRRIKHYNEAGKCIEIDFFQFIRTHFCLNTGYATPRLIILFLDKCMAQIKEYYEKNYDETVSLDHNKEYPLIKREFINDAYRKYQEDIWTIFLQHCPENWRLWLNRFKKERGNSYSFSYQQIYKIVQPKEENEFHQFLAFVSHLGLWECKNKDEDYLKRQYILPVLFRQCVQIS